MSTTKPEALRLAEGLESIFISEEIHATKAQKIAAELRRLHARIAEMEAQLGSSGFTAADMATAAAQGFRDGVASLAASAAPLSCGHHASMMPMSAETGNPLYCELCDSIDRRRDAETIAEERRQQLVDMKSINAQLIDALKTVRSQESDLWAPWLIKQVDAALAKRPIAEHTSASLAASAGSEPVAWLVGGGRIFVDKPFLSQDAALRSARDRADGAKVTPLYTHPSPPEGAGWMPIETAPKDVSILLFTGGVVAPVYCGRQRYGTLGEPQQHEFAWRCDSSGRFATPRLWMHIPPLPASEAKGA